MRATTRRISNVCLDLGCCTLPSTAFSSKDPSVSHITSTHSLFPLKTWSAMLDSSRDGKLGGGVTYELQYRSRVGQDWILMPTKTPNKILTGLSPGQVYDFRVRALNSAGWGDFSAMVEVQMPSERKAGRDDQASEATD